MTVLTHPPRAPRGRRYQARLMHLARTLFGDGSSWTCTDIRRYLIENEGADGLDLDTVQRWVDPKYAERRRRQNREARRRAAAQKRTAPKSVGERMTELRASGLSYSSIAKVIGLDFGLRLTAEQVRYCLRSGRDPQALRPRRVA